MTAQVVVVGSANVDSFFRMAALPLPGETVLASGVLVAVGGKGANQAIAAARTGVPVRFVGAVGRDTDGDRIVTTLEGAGVATDGVSRADMPTGRALILVDDAGENTIVVSSGANASATGEADPEATDVVVVQGELPVPVTVATIETASRIGARVVVNLAPFVDLGGAERAADPLVLNEIEAEQLLGAPVDGADAPGVARLRDHARSAVVTLGAAGALVVEDAAVTAVPAPAAEHVVDTTGAGDAFVGVLAAALASGADLVAATRVAVRAATASVAVLGAGESYPAFTLDG